MFGSKKTSSTTQDFTKDYYLEENASLTEYGAESKIGSTDLNLSSGKNSINNFDVEILDGGAISDSYDFAKATTTQTVGGAVNLATASMDTLRAVTKDALEGSAAAGQRETETAMFALQKANVITGDMPSSTIETLTKYAAVVSVIIALYQISKGKS